MHEVAHALGFGVADSFYNLIQGGAFAGPEARIAFANSSGPRSVPLSDAGHFRDDGNFVCTEPENFASNGINNVLSKTLGLFGTPRNRDQQVLMDSGTCDSTSYHPVMTQLDLAALKDIGWNVIEQLDPESLDLKIDVAQGSVLTPPVLTFVTQPEYSYQLQRSDNLLVWESVGSAVEGNGDTRSLSDTNPLPGGCSYRITIAAPVSPPPIKSKLLKFLLPLPAKGTPTIGSNPARICAECEFHDHHHEEGGDED